MLFAALALEMENDTAWVKDRQSGREYEPEKRRKAEVTLPVISGRQTLEIEL